MFLSLRTFSVLVVVSLVGNLAATKMTFYCVLSSTFNIAPHCGI